MRTLLVIALLLPLSGCASCEDPPPQKPPTTAAKPGPSCFCADVYLSAACLIVCHPPAAHDPPDDSPYAPPGYEPPKPADPAP
mgnify:CR=1 FL=1